MSDHLTECECYGRNHGECALCICDRLRACQERVRLIANDALWLHVAREYQRALDAAEAAVAELTDKGDSVRPADVMAAIRALKENA